MKIAFTGSIGVGKTTLVEAMRTLTDLKTHEFYPSVSSLCKTKPHEDPREHNIQRQNKMDELLFGSGHPNIVVDRYFTDRLAWEILWPTPEYHTKLVVDAVKSIEYTKDQVTLFYLPAYEFEFRGDTKSPMRDPRRRYEMDEEVVNLLRAFRIPFLTVTGSVEERLTMIQKVLERNIRD
jgi:hypothetical protein